MPIFIYVLQDPFTGEFRYIGKSIDPVKRLGAHCRDRSKCHRVHWIQSVMSKGRTPMLRVLQKVPFWASWQDCERMWIDHAIRSCWPITNSTSGGDGVPDLSGESKERMLKTWKGRTHKPESLVKIGAASRGRRHTEEYKEFMRETMSARVFTPEHRRRLSESGRKLDQAAVSDTRNRLSRGEKQKDIARDYGVHRMTISRIKCGHSYGTTEIEGDEK